MLNIFLIPSTFYYRDEFYNKDRSTGHRAIGGIGGLAANWHSGLFDFGSDDDTFWRSPQTPKAQVNDKESSPDEEDDDREPLDVEFVSGPIGGDPAGDTDIAMPEAGFPFFPFGNFGGVFPFPSFGGPSFKPWWKGWVVFADHYIYYK